MAKYNSPAYRNTKVVRINIGTYQLLAELATKHRVTIAEALDRLITASAEKEAVIVPQVQIPMPIFATRAKPVFSVNGTKRSALSIRSQPTLAVRPKGGRIQ